MLGNAMLVYTLGWAMLVCFCVCGGIIYTISWPMLCCHVFHSCAFAGDVVYCALYSINAGHCNVNGAHAGHCV